MTSRRTSVLVLVSLVGVWASAGRGELLDLTATVESEVAELTPGAESDFAQEGFPETTNQLPMAAVAHVITESTEGDPVGGGRAHAVFNDPRTPVGIEPIDFGADGAVYTHEGEIAYVAAALASETRTIRHLAIEVGEPAGSQPTFNGRFLVKGVLAIFAQSEGLDWDGTQVRLQLTVQQQGAGATTEVFSTWLDLAGTADGQASTAAEGSLARVPVAVIEVDPTEEFGRIVILVIPEIILRYSYTAIVGEQFSLTGSIALDLANTGEGVGAAAAIGIPPDALADTVDEVVGGAAGQNLALAIQAARALADVGVFQTESVSGQEPDESIVFVGTEGRCASFGAEVPLLGFAGLTGMLLSAPRLRRRETD
jgi:hypothetical protein